MPFTVEETQSILTAIRDNKEFRSKFSAIAEDIIDKIYTYFTNPNCTCKSSIIEWVSKNEDKTRELINNFKEFFDKLKQTSLISNSPSTTLEKSTPIPPSNLKLGETFVIDPSPEAYKKFYTMTKNENWIFRGLQVIPGEEDGKDVWFVLLY